jgi:hypothetical protein
MSPLLLLIGVVVLLIFVAAVMLARKASGAASDPAATAGADYQVRPAVLSAAERSFLGVLEPLLPEGVGYLVKIRLGDVFVTRKGLTASRRTSAWNRINQKHVDFLLVNTTELKPLAGIELDDSSHAEDRRKTRDAFVDDVFRSCGLPLLHVTAQTTYNPTDLRTKVAALLASPQAGRMAA